MKSKLYLLLLVFGVFALSTPTVSAQKGNGKGNGTVEPYSITAQALRGQTDTEVTVTLATSKPATSPIPAVLKKLQLKIRNAAGDVVYIKNFQNLPVTGSKVVVNVTEPAQHNTLEVLAQVKTTATVDAEMLKTSAVVLLRPNLIVESINGPAEQLINTPFNLEAVVKETNLQVGATATVNLSLLGNPVGQIPGVTVPAGGSVSVVFVGLTSATAGPAEYTVTISNASPAEFNVADNSKNFSTVFINPLPAVTEAYYSLQYYSTRNYNYNYQINRVSNGELLYQQYHDGNWEGLYYDTYTYQQNLNVGQTMSADYKIETSSGQVLSGSFENLSSNYYYYYYYQYFNGFDPVNQVYFYGYVDPNSGYIHGQIQRYRNNAVYFYYYYNSSTDYSQTNDPLASFLNEDTELKVSLVTTYDGFSFGGGAVLGLSPLQHYSYSESGYTYWNNYYYYDYYYDDYATYIYHQSYDHTYGYAGGTTDPTMLPKAGVLQNPGLSEVAFGLDKVYQNGTNATVQFSLSQEAPYVLNVTDMQGRTALRVVEGKQPAGMQLKQLDVSKLNPGIYVFTLKSGSQTETKKVILN